MQRINDKKNKFYNVNLTKEENNNSLEHVESTCPWTKCYLTY
jgi:hypothetical protein